MLYKYVLAITLLASKDVCQSEPIHLLFSTWGDADKVYTFRIDIDIAKQEVFVDDQYTSEVSVSQYLTRFVLTSEDDGYSFDM